MPKICLQCNKEFKRIKGTDSNIHWEQRKFCSRICLYEYQRHNLNKGTFQKGVSHGYGFKKGCKHAPYIHKSNQGFQKGHGLLGNNLTSKGKHWKHSEEAKQKIKLSKLGKKLTKEHINSLIKSHLGKFIGESSPRWIKDRTKLSNYGKKNGFEYAKWRKEVYTRDNWKCKINNGDCIGRIEAHHILNWKDFPKLRYDINNGITLCHYHHPLKWKEEERLSPYFKELINGNTKR